MAVGDSVYRVALKYTMAGKVYVNVLHFQQPSTDPLTFPDGSLGDIGNQAAVDWNNNVQAHVNVACVLDTVVTETLRVGVPEGGLETVPHHFKFSPQAQVITSPGPYAGALMGDYLPAFNAFSIRKRTVRPGRQWRGSFHQAGVSESSTVGNDIDPALLGAYEADFRAFILLAQVLVVGGQFYNMLPVIWSNRAADLVEGLVSIAGNYTSQIVASTTSPHVGTMRRRKVK